MQQSRKDYREEVRDIDAKDMVFLDETAVNLELLRLYARSPKGERAYGKKSEKKKKITLVGALSLHGFIGGFEFEGSLNGDIFKFILEKCLVPNLWPGAVLFMDNLSAHKVEGIEEIVESVGAKVMYLSPYSPDFNPIENLWSKLKAYLRAVGARTKQALEQAISEALEIIGLDEIFNWFAHSCYCTEDDLPNCTSLG